MEDFVTYELAVKLEQKGFKQGYNIFGVRPIFSNETTIKFINEIGAYEKGYFGENIPAPTISQVLKWLREEKNLSVEPYSCACGWRVTICKTGNVLEGYISGGTCVKDEVKGNNEGGAFDQFEGAALAGIKYVLDNLI